MARSAINLPIIDAARTFENFVENHNFYRGEKESYLRDIVKMAENMGEIAESIGIVNGTKKIKTVDCFEYFNEETKFLAMEQWTGFHASMVMQHISNDKVPLGAHPIEKALSGKDFYDYAIQRGYNIRIT